MRSLGSLAHKGVGRLASSNAPGRPRLPRPLQGAKAATLALSLVYSGINFGDSVAGGLAEDFLLWGHLLTRLKRQKAQVRTWHRQGT